MQQSTVNRSTDKFAIKHVINNRSMACTCRSRQIGERFMVLLLEPRGLYPGGTSVWKGATFMAIQLFHRLQRDAGRYRASNFISLQNIQYSILSASTIVSQYVSMAGCTVSVTCLCLGALKWHVATSRHLFFYRRMCLGCELTLMTPGTLTYRRIFT